MFVLTVAFDVDGVLANFTTGIRDLLDRPDLPEPRRWNWSDLGLNVGEVWEKIREAEDFWERLSPLAGVQMLKESCIRGEFIGRKFLFITSRPEVKGKSTHRQTANWIEKHLGLLLPTVYVCKNSYEKLGVLKREKVDFFIDDFAPLVEIARPVCKGAHLLRQPWNDVEENSYGIPAVWSVREFLRKVKEREEK